MPTGVLVGTYLVFHTHASPATCLASREVSGQGCQVCNWAPVAFVAAGETAQLCQGDGHRAWLGGLTSVWKMLH